jgi:hypothetical protein
VTSSVPAPVPAARTLAARAAVRSLLTAPADGHAAAADLPDLLAMQAELTAAIAARVQVVDRSGVWQDDGSRAVHAWLKRHATTPPTPLELLPLVPDVDAGFVAGHSDGQGEGPDDDPDAPPSPTGTRRQRPAPMSDGTAQSWVHQGRDLASFPALADALGDARLSAEHARVVGSALRELKRRVVGTVWDDPTWLALQERAVVAAARLADPARLRKELTARLQALCPEPAARDAEQRRDKRFAKLTPGYDGMWNLTALLDPAGGQALKEALLAWRRGDHTAGDTRTPAQRDADAITALATVFLDRGETTQRGVAPHLVVLVPEARMAAHQAATLGSPADSTATGSSAIGSSTTGSSATDSEDSGRAVEAAEAAEAVCDMDASAAPSPGRPAGQGHDPGPIEWPDPFTQPLFTRDDGTLLDHTSVRLALEHPDLATRLELRDALGQPVPPATYTDGTPVAETDLARMLCHARLTRLVLDVDSQPLDVGRTSRTHSHAMWLAAMTRYDWQCATDGCTAPASRIEMHHATWWRDGGTTNATEGIPLCHGTRSCHTRVHEGHPLLLRDGQLLTRTGLHPADHRDAITTPAEVKGRAGVDTAGAPAAATATPAAGRSSRAAAQLRRAPATLDLTAYPTRERQWWADATPWQRTSVVEQHLQQLLDAA